MSAQHTPGPWEVICPDFRRVNIKAGLASIASVSVTNVDFSHNARLIAAAPELLAALEDLRAKFIAIVDNEWGEGAAAEWMPESVDAAIAKATRG